MNIFFKIRFRLLYFLRIILLIVVATTRAWCQVMIQDPSFVHLNGDKYASSNFIIQPDNKILIGGQQLIFNGIVQQGIVRLNADGTIDTTFHTGTGLMGSQTNSNMNAWGVAYSIDLQSNGKILVAGDFTRYNDIPRNNLLRLHADGTLDTTFDPKLSTGNTSIVCVKSLPNEKIFISGSFPSFNGIAQRAVVRVNKDGLIDRTFNPEPTLQHIGYLLPLSNGQVFIAGQFKFPSTVSTLQNIARLNIDGSVDLSYNIGGVGANDLVDKIIPQTDGKYIIVGRFTSYNGIARAGIARLNNDGSLDQTFDPGISPIGSYASSSSDITLQADGKIILARDFTSFNGIPAIGIVRLNTDGSVDISFKTSLETTDHINSIAIQSDGKLLLSGLKMPIYSNSTVYGIGVMRLTPCDFPPEIINQSACKSFTYNNHLYTQSGQYTQVIQVAPQCERFVILNLIIHPPVDSSTYIAGDYTLTATANHGIYQWIDCSTNQIISGATNQTFTPTTNGDYAVHMNIFNCMATSSCISITNVPAPKYPNLITPNGDGKNDFLEFPNQALNLQLLIYNSWGAKVYESQDYHQGWPTEIESGLYYYELSNNEGLLHKSWLQVLK